MAEEAKAVIIKRLTDQGYTSGYGTLLFLTAYLGADPESLEPENAEERFEWRGHFRGLRAALACLAMHERQLEADAAATVVGWHIADAIEDLDHSGESR